MRKLHCICLLIGIFFFEGALAGVNCTTGPYTEQYCEHGCCYNDDDSYDSSASLEDFYAHCCLSAALTGIIVGAVVGGIVLITIIIVVVIFCVKKKHGKVACGRGFKNRSSGGHNTTLITQHRPPPQPPTGGYSYGQPYATNSSGQAFGPQYQMGALPSQYPPGPPPKEGMYTDPAYPPTTAPPPYTNP